MSRSSTEKKTSKINNYFKSSPQQNTTPKRPNSSLSPPENLHQQKKPNMNTTPEKSITKLDSPISTGNDAILQKGKESNQTSSLQEIIGPLIDEVKLMQESFHRDISLMDKKLENAIQVQKEEFNRLEHNMKSQKDETTQVLTSKIYVNTTNINQLLEENRQLKRENSELHERLTRIEVTQLVNNIILSGMPEAPWERYETTKERVVEAIASTMGSKDDDIKAEARKIEINCCSRIGSYKLGRPRPISVSFQ